MPIEFKHFLLSPTDLKLALYLESIGYNPDQKAYHRTNGYPYYHWLQTSEGRGKFWFSGETYVLDPGQGILLHPNVPHHYEKETDVWRTYFVTFSGSIVQSLLSTFEFNFSAYCKLEQANVMTDYLDEIIARTKSSVEFTGLDGSAVVYQFLLLLKKYGQINNNASLSHSYDRLSRLLVWLDEHYGNPGIGLGDMADFLHISPQHLNTLFRSAFGNSPYSYLLQLRIQKAKEWLSRDRSQTVKAVAGYVGFNDTSHFVSTFHRIEGMTPDAYKKLF